MSKYLISNANGDWWELDTETGAGQDLWIIETSKLEAILREDEHSPIHEIDIYGIDKLERDIQDHGAPFSVKAII